MTNRDVAQHWALGHAARTPNLHTDGKTLYSYRMAIGITRPDGTKVAILSTQQSSNRTHHTALAVNVADARATFAEHSWCVDLCEHARLAVQS